MPPVASTVAPYPNISRSRGFFPSLTTSSMASYSMNSIAFWYTYIDLGDRGELAALLDTCCEPPRLARAYSGGGGAGVVSSSSKLSD